MRYDHTQHAPLYLILVVFGVWMLAGAWFTPVPIVQVILIGCSGLMLLLAISFHHLTVRDEGDHLRIQFGPLPLFQRQVPYADIERVERGRTTIFDSWGIHLSPRGGWVWNLWGFDCVVMHLTRGRTLRIGTNDPEGLEEFLRQR